MEGYWLRWPTRALVHTGTVETSDERAYGNLTLDISPRTLLFIPSLPVEINNMLVKSCLSSVGLSLTKANSCQIWGISASCSGPPVQVSSALNHTASPAPGELPPVAKPAPSQPPIIHTNPSSYRRAPNPQSHKIFHLNPYLPLYRK